MGAGVYMATRADVDPKRIGVWGGSYGRLFDGDGSVAFERLVRSGRRSPRRRTIERFAKAA